MNTLRNQKKSLAQSGFTLIEILVVIGLVAILAAIVIIAINPARQFAQGRDTQRNSNLNAILNAVGQRIADNKGIFEGTVAGNAAYKCGPIPTSGPMNIKTTIAADTSTETGDLGCLVPTYITAIPLDPTATGTDTKYTIEKDASTGRVTVKTTVDEPAIPRTAAITITR